MCLSMEGDTHAVFSSHSALLHVLRLPRQFLGNEKTANCQHRDLSLLDIPTVVAPNRSSAITRQL